ncbi:hypothetical protein NKG94_49910 [Micromonospora sp. M12]
MSIGGLVLSILAVLIGLGLAAASPPSSTTRTRWTASRPRSTSCATRSTECQRRGRRPSRPVPVGWAACSARSPRSATSPRCARVGRCRAWWRPTTWARTWRSSGRGQGPKALIAEVICGELARRLELRVPPLVVLDIDPVIGRAEPDQEVQELLGNSGGANLGMDFLPGALGFDPLAHPSTRCSPRGCCGSTRTWRTSTGAGATPTCSCGIGSCG